MGIPADRGAAASRASIPSKGAGQDVHDPRGARVEPKLKALVRRATRRSASCSTQAKKLEGLTRHAGMHAAGVVISEGPLWDHVPVLQERTSTLVTQYDKDDVEQAGLVKFDFLGLKTLTVIDIAVRLINARPDLQGGKPLRHRRDPARRRGDLRAPASRARRRASSSSSRAACSSSSRTSSPTASRTSSPPWRSTARVRSAPAW